MTEKENPFPWAYTGTWKHSSDRLIGWNLALRGTMAGLCLLICLTWHSINMVTTLVQILYACLCQKWWVAKSSSRNGSAIVAVWQQILLLRDSCFILSKLNSQKAALWSQNYSIYNCSSDLRSTTINQLIPPPSPLACLFALDPLGLVQCLCWS